MTNDEAIFVLQHVKTHGALTAKAKEMAITALKQPPRVQSEWIYDLSWKCSVCNWKQNHDFDAVPNDSLKYCPNCGAEMTKEREENA